MAGVHAQHSQRNQQRRSRLQHEDRQLPFPEFVLHGKREAHQRSALHPRAHALAGQPLAQAADRHGQQPRHGQLVKHRRSAFAAPPRQQPRRQQRAQRRTVEHEAALPGAQHAQRPHFQKIEARSRQAVREPSAHERRRNAPERQVERIDRKDRRSRAVVLPIRLVHLCRAQLPQRQHGQQRGKRHACAVHRVLHRQRGRRHEKSKRGKHERQQRDSDPPVHVSPKAALMIT